MSFGGRTKDLFQSRGYLTELLNSSGLLSVWNALGFEHTRGMASSWAQVSGMSIEDICLAAGVYRVLKKYTQVIVPLLFKKCSAISAKVLLQTNTCKSKRVAY